MRERNLVLSTPSPNTGEICVQRSSILFSLRSLSSIMFVGLKKKNREKERKRWKRKISNRWNVMEISSGWNRLGDKWRARKTDWLTALMEGEPNRNVGARKILYFFVAISHFIFLFWISLFFSHFHFYVPFRNVYLHFYSFYSSFIVYGRANVLLVFCSPSIFVCVFVWQQRQWLNRSAENGFCLPYLFSPVVAIHLGFLLFIPAVIDLIQLPFEYIHTCIMQAYRHFVVSHRRASVAAQWMLHSYTVY